MRAYVTQVEVLRRLRNGGRQFVRVEHVHVNEGGQGTRLCVDSLEGFLGLLEIGAVELRPWNATVEDIERADRLVIDLAPGEGVPWDAVVEAAFRLRELMKNRRSRAMAQVNRPQGASSYEKGIGPDAFTMASPFRARH